MSYYSSTTVSASGSDQSGATQLSDPYCEITSGTGGVKLPALNGGMAIVKIKNSTLSAVNVYPQSGAYINYGEYDAPFSLHALSTVICVTGDGYVWGVHVFD